MTVGTTAVRSRVLWPFCAPIAGSTMGGEVSFMDVAVVYESIYGNTRTIAEAVAEGVRETDPAAHVAVLAVREATPDRIDGAALLIVGGPTHIRGMSRPSSRRMAPATTDPATDGEPAAPVVTEADEPGVREWLDTLPKPAGRRMAAAFDTRLPSAMAGGAAKSIGRKLRHHGYRLVAQPKGFVVDDAQGPLRTGECDQARQWGAGLVRQMAH